jgi:hypothetical protein
MKCEKIKKNLIDFQWGELTEKETKEMKEHLVSCLHCLQYEKEVKEFLLFMKKVEMREPSEKPYLFLKSRVEEQRYNMYSSWIERVVSIIRRPVPVYQAAFVALGLVLFAWFGGNVTGKKEVRLGKPSPPSKTESMKWQPLYPDTHISFVVTPTVWTRVHSTDTIP